MNSWKDIVEFVRSTYQIQGKVNITPYTYRVLFSSLTAGTTQFGTLNANASSDFILLRPTFRANSGDGAANVVPLVRCLLTDTGSSVQLSDVAVDLTAMFSNNSLAESAIVYPRVISGRSSLQVQVQNYSSATSYDLELDFTGVLVQSYN